MATHRYAIAPTVRLVQAVDDVIADARRLLTAARMIVARQRAEYRASRSTFNRFQFG
jgi:hypothetical protein